MGARRCRRTAHRVVLVAALLLLAAACGDEPRAAVDAEPAPRSDDSSPFTVKEVPDGYRLVTAGRGTQRPDWGSDSFGTQEPFTVLGPDGAAAAEELIVVSITGFENYQGGLAQASRAYLEEPRELSLDGRRALFAPAAGDAWADLVAVAGDDLAVRVTAPDATQEELVEVLRRVAVPADRTRAPAVVDAPHDLEVVGALDADAVVALSPGVTPRSEHVPGPTTGHAAGWVAGDEQETLSVVTLPAGAADLAALTGARAFPQFRQGSVEPVTIAGRPAALVERTRREWTTRAVWLRSAWGDTVVVTATGRAVPELSVLQAVAESVERSERSAWDAFVVEAAGGPGLHPDHGRREIARGTAGGGEWLLQTGSDGAGLVETGEGHAPTVADRVDPCLKLSGRRRACATNSLGGVTDWVAYSETGEDGMPPFVVVSSPAAASQVRITTATDDAVEPLVPVPGTQLRAAVVTVDDPASPFCSPTGELPDAPVATMRVEVLDATGHVVECIGMTPAPAG